MNHKRFIRSTYVLANNAKERGDHPFGALLVRDDSILFTAENTVVTAGDPTQHAELNLLRDAQQKLGTGYSAGSILYTSTEPCVMCSGAIYWAGISTVVFGCSARMLSDYAGDELTTPCKEIFARGKRPTLTIGPVLEEEGLTLHKDFWQAIVRKSEKS